VQELESSIGKLSLSPQNNKKTSTPKKRQPIADSWEDDDLSSGDETDRPISHQSSVDYPSAPPPTPINGAGYSPFEEPWGPGGASYDDNSLSPRSERTGSNTRPEKTDAVVKRLIAGALGVRAPKKTEQQRAYERAVKEKEMKRRNGEKEARIRAEEEAKRAKAAAWGD
jgi:hypothetical protein